MPDEAKTNLRLEIAHVLFMDIVGYSKLTTDEQSELLHELNAIVRRTETAQTAEGGDQLIFLPTGDGMALVFTGSEENPVECALEMAQALRAKPSLPVRMGIHSGPVRSVADVNHRRNIAGAGINIAQRIMDCGDAGHILVSKRVADDLAQSRRWQPYLHDLGDVTVKHGEVVSVVNFYADVIGNPARPTRIQGNKKGTATSANSAKRFLVTIFGAIAGLLLIGWLVLSQRTVTKEQKQGSTQPTVVQQAATSATPSSNASTDAADASRQSFIAAENDYGAALELFAGLNGKKIDDAEALRLTERASQSHLPEAEARLAHWNHTGFASLKKDDTRATELANLALADGLTARADTRPAAQQMLGLLYDEGLVPGKNKADALQLFENAAAKGDIHAQFTLGQLYAQGIAGIQDMIKAVDFYRKAADGGNAFAQNALGLCYERGSGVPKDLSRALALYKRAAERGLRAAQDNLTLLSLGGDKSEFHQALIGARQVAEMPAAKNYQQKVSSILWRHLNRATEDCANGPRSDTQIVLVLIISRKGEVLKKLVPHGQPFLDCIATKFQPPRLPEPPKDSWPVLVQSHFVSWNFKEHSQ